MQTAMSLVGWSIGLWVWVALGWWVFSRAFVAGRWTIRASTARLGRGEHVATAGDVAAEVIDLREHRRAQRAVARAGHHRRAA